jgi:hypothetical protein
MGMATLVMVLFLIVAVALVAVSLRALVVAFEALRLTYRLKLLARTTPDQDRRPATAEQLAHARSCYPPIRVLYATRSRLRD